MSARVQPFGEYRDWLTQTLGHAGPELPECSFELQDGSQLSQLATGVLELRPPPSSDRPPREALILSAGIHGNETAPIEILNTLLEELLDGQLQLACPTLLILGNPGAMQAGKRFIDTNLNRLFSGAYDQPQYRGLPEAHRARLLENRCQEFLQRQRLPASHYDLHTAIRPSRREMFALYPYRPGRAVPAPQLSFLREAQIGTLLLQSQGATTFSSFTAGLDTESFTMELGKVMPFGGNDHSRFRGIASALRRRIQGLNAPDTSDKPLTVFEVVHEIINTGPGFRLLVPEDAANFTEYPPGTLIWEDDTGGYRVGSRPECVVFPNRAVPEGQRAGLMVRPLPSPAD